MLSRMGVFAALLSTFLVVAGCGGGSSSTPPPPPPPTISIAMTGAPQTLTAGATVQLTATVSNDSSNQGVDWTCAPAGSCGSFNPTHTASGSATTFTAPTAAGNVTITATATASATATATATISVTSASQQVTVAISGAPATLALNATAQLTANVTNDSTNAGVDWTCAPAGTCGAFSPAHTASGSATTYTAPAAAASITVTATSTAQTSSTATATITVGTATGGTSLAAGSFAFVLIGHDSGTHAYSLAGSATLDGNGNVTGGEQDYNNAHGTISPTGGDHITGGTYSVGANGVGTLSLITNNALLGTNGTENFSLTVVNSKHALLTQTDASGTAGGTLDMQTLAGNGLKEINGNYSFIVAGTTGATQEVFGGVLKFDGAGNLHVTLDSNTNGAVHTNGSNASTYTMPDASGRSTMSFGGDNFVMYVVGPEVLRIIVVNAGETDAGSAFGSGAGPLSAASLTGSFVFKEGSAVTGSSSFVAAGQFTTDGNGNITKGVADTDVAGTVSSAAAFGGTYTIGANGYGNATVNGNSPLAGAFGLYAVDPAVNILDPNNSSAGGGGALLLDLRPAASAVGSGIILPQAASPTFTGNYAVDFRRFTPGGIEQNLDGQISVASGLVITGTGDAADLQTGSPHLAVALTGTAAADAANPGRFTLPLTIALGATPPALNFVIYQASTGQLLWVETDTAQYVSGSIEQQQ